MNTPVLLAGYDPAREFRTNFESATMAAPVPRKSRGAGGPTRERKTYIFEGTCACCGADFTRKIRIGAEEPRFCGIPCAQTTRWHVKGKAAFGGSKRNQTFGALPYGKNR